MPMITFDRATVDGSGAFLVGELERLDQTLNLPLVGYTRRATCSCAKTFLSPMISPAGPIPLLVRLAQALTRTVKLGW